MDHDAGVAPIPDAKIPCLLFQDGQDPRTYFVGRIRKQAEMEGLQFTEFEEKYLSLTEHGDDDGAVRMLKELKGKKLEEFDLRINSLAWRAYNHDLAALPEAKERYENAMTRLASIDQWPNLSMFINSLYLGRPPERFLGRSSWPALIILGLVLSWILYHVIRHLLHHPIIR